MDIRHTQDEGVLNLKRVNLQKVSGALSALECVALCVFNPAPFSELVGGFGTGSQDQK